MRLMLWLMAVAAVLYGGFWVVGSRAVLTGTNAALAGLKAEGRGDFGTVSLSGFPSRFDLRIETPSLQSTDGLVAWQAPFLQIYALSYKPNHIITVFPSTQTVTLASQALNIASMDSRASIVLGIGADLPVDHAQMVSEKVSIASDMGWSANLAVARLAIRQDKTEANGQEIGIELFGIDLLDTPAVLMAGSAPPPMRIVRARLDGTLSLDGPINRFTPQDGIGIQTVDIRALELDWGKVRLRGEGTLVIDAAGQPEGRIDLRVTDWRKVMTAATDLGLVRTEFAKTAENALAQLALASGDAETLEMPLKFSAGRASLGPFPLGPAPQF